MDEIPAHLKILASCPKGKARASVLTLPHGEIKTPIFMPVGTQGTVKGIRTDQLEKVGCPIILGNTFHLGLRPGSSVFDEVGGLHKFMSWKKNILTDSGGFQMVSLLDLAEITEEGVSFRSPHDGRQTMLTPEESIRIQNSIGADIIMQLDDVVSSTSQDLDRMREAMGRSIRWLDRCKAAHRRPRDQALFAIIQGGLDPDLRKECLKEMISRDTPGYAIGGLAGGESKEDFVRMIDVCTDFLPANKPRYLMGVGYPLDIVIASALGVDMFDCVYPTRTGRFGTALTWSGTMNLRSSHFKNDMRPVDEECPCSVCKEYTRSYLHTVVSKETVGCSLVSLHNISFLVHLTSQIHEAICKGEFESFLKWFMWKQFPDGSFPKWAVGALKSVGYTLE